MRKLLLMLMFVLSGFSYGASAMDQALMEKTVKSMTQNSKGEKGVVEFEYNNVKMYLVSDVAHDRMRIISAITEYEKLTIQQVDTILESNFHKSLDARYAVSEGILYSAYIHPLSELSQAQIESAVHQVANLALSFGNEYSSGVLSFGGKEQ